MSLNIRLKHSESPDAGSPNGVKQPQDSDLVKGELAVNINQIAPSGYALNEAGHVQQMFGPAREDQAGQLPIADDAKAKAGSDDASIITPLKLEAVNAVERTANDSKYVDVTGDTMTGDLNVTGANVVVDGDISATGNAVVAGDIQSTSQNGGPLAGLRNQLINGDFQIIQRLNGYNATQQITLNQPQYFADRWGFISANSGTVRVNTSSAFPNYTLRQGANVAGLRQPIELPQTGACGPFTIGSTWTVSVWSDIDLSDASNFEGPTLVFADHMGISAGQNQAAPRTPWVSTGQSINGFTKYSSTQTINASPLSTNVCLELILQKKNKPVNQAFDWAQVQFEPGPVATPFEHRPIGTELALCQRYFQIISFNNIVFNAISSSTNAIPKTGGAGTQRTGSPTITSLGTQGNKVFYNTGRYEGDATKNSDNANVAGGLITNGTASITFPRKGKTDPAIFCTVGGGDSGKFSYDCEL